MDLSIIIVNWNSKDFLRKCLQSVRANPPRCSFEIIVVDGGSFDGCDEMLAREFPEVVFVQSRENVGFARSNNLGVESAEGAAFLFLNPDTEVMDAALDGLLAVLAGHLDAGIVAPKLLNSDGSLQTSCVQALPTLLNQMFDSVLLHRLFPRSRLWGMSALWSDGSPAVVEAVPGACLLIRANLFRRLGGFGPLYFMYGEDMDLCARTRQAGFSVFYASTARVLHHGGGSSKNEGSRFSNVMLRESVHCYFKQNHGAGAAAGYRVAILGCALIRLLLLLPVCLSRNNKRRSAFQKWIANLRWAVGLESWAASYRPVPVALPVAPGQAVQSSVGVR